MGAAMIHRRQFLGSIVVPAAAWSLAGAAALRANALERIAELGKTPGDPRDLAQDEAFWFQVQEAFTADRSMVNLNNGGVCPAPASVQAAMKRYLDHANTSPAYVLWRLQEPQKETVRKGLAALFGCDTEEIAITRNASESLENAQQGFDLQPGDEILTTNQDYPRMLTAWKQRERREKIVLKQFSIPVPCEDPGEIVRLFEEHITEKTRLILMCHVINLTGQVMPVKAVVAMARKRGIPVIVDGAHSFAHLDFKQADLDCDYFGTSLHKFLFAPHGTGLLYVRKEKIPALWPLMAAPESMDADIRKFEEIGTHPAANTLAIADALTFHAGIGPARKQERMLYLRDRWAKRLESQPRFRLHTSLKPGFATGVANVEIEGIDAPQLADHLWEKEKIFTVAIVFKNPDGVQEFQGLRVSPAVYTRLEEIDRFSAAMERVAKNGLPG
jgi:selenocysteine lyase/cysteine desulfurase